MRDPDFLMMAGEACRSTHSVEAVECWRRPMTA